MRKIIVREALTRQQTREKYGFLLLCKNLWATKQEKIWIIIAGKKFSDNKSRINSHNYCIGNFTIKGYEIQYSTDKRFKKDVKVITIKKAKTTKKTINKLQSKKKYYVRIRTFKKSGSKKAYSN